MRILITRDELQKRVAELGKEISDVYGDEPVTMLVVLKGSYIFAADLLRSITCKNIEVDFVQLSSYRGTQSTGKVEFVLGELEKYRGKNLIIVEDIVDTGTTLSYFAELLAQVKPLSIKICSCLEKSEINQGKVKIDFLGFDIPNKFVLGYGLDYNELYRNIPEIVIYNED